MRKLVCLSALVAAVLSSGCVAVSAKGNRWGTRYQVFVVKEQVYVFDAVDGCVARVDVSNPPPFEPRNEPSNCDSE